jgi:pyruvate formate lyase activating enzyme
VEITNLVIPTLNDSEEDIRDLVQFVASVGRGIPLHFSRYFPAHKMTIQPTPMGALERASEIAREKLDYVYMGNVGFRGADTICPGCGATLVARPGYDADTAGIENGSCRQCARPADFVWCD